MELLEVSRKEAKLLGFQSSSGAHHLVEEFRYTGFERDLPSPDLLFGIFLEVIGHLFNQS